MTAAPSPSVLANSPCRELRVVVFCFSVFRPSEQSFRSRSGRGEPVGSSLCGGKSRGSGYVVKRTRVCEARAIDALRHSWHFPPLERYRTKGVLINSIRLGIEPRPANDFSFFSLFFSFLFFPSSLPSFLPSFTSLPPSKVKLPFSFFLSFPPRCPPRLDVKSSQPRDLRLPILTSSPPSCLSPFPSPYLSTYLRSSLKKRKLGKEEVL